MLVLSRRFHERVRCRIGDVDLWVSIEDIDRGKIRLGFCAPLTVDIQREENLPDSETFLEVQARGQQ